jgi:alkanesulfonate monooxygenase SsuD/methylene tetrahydromethanopterin reductase-like flavin-dependent oxidoreductase (luciferase family)
MLQLRDDAYPHWSGRHRPALTGQGVFPRPVQERLPMWLGVGGTPASFVRAGLLGMPLMVAIIGGEPRRFRQLIDLYRQAGAQAGHAPESLLVGVHCFGFVAETDAEAADTFWPGYEQAFTSMGRERGFPPPTRAGYDASLGEHGPYFIGSPATVAAKMAALSPALGGLSRFTVQMTNAIMAPDTMLRSIELLGTEVMPRVAGTLAG